MTRSASGGLFILPLCVAPELHYFRGSIHDAGGS